jgi:methyl-accepting chemotaxis protein
MKFFPWTELRAGFWLWHPDNMNTQNGNPKTGDGNRMHKELASADHSAACLEELRNFAVRIEAGVRSELATVREGIEQAEGLVRDAVNKIGGSFRGLDQQARGQLSLVSSLIENLTGSAAKNDSRHVGMQQFTRETSAVLENYVGFTDRSSRQSAEVARKIDEMAERMGSIFGVLEQINAIARQTNLLALNAAIEAARAGEVGRGFAVVAQEVKSLSNSSRSLSEEIATHVEETRQTVAEARRIVNEVAAEDTSAARDASTRVKSMMKDLGDVESQIGVSLEKISVTTRQIHNNIGLAIRALQFEDIVRQLLEYNRARLEKVEELVFAFTSSLENLGHHDLADPAALDTQLNRIMQQWTDGLQKLQAEVHRPVHQQSMTAGEVELF